MGLVTSTVALSITTTTALPLRPETPRGFGGRLRRGPCGEAVSGPRECQPTRPLAAFIEAFRTVGYEICGDGAFEEGWEKVAIYARSGTPTHAARQVVAEGKWMSKLGRGYDIAHDDVDGVGGQPGYGEVVVFMRRPIDRSSTTEAS